MNRSAVVVILVAFVVAFISAGPDRAAGSGPAPPADPAMRRHQAGVAHDDPVRQAALRTYVHGMTDEIAREQVGRMGIPTLLALLEEPGFSRRDNLVAFLAHLAGDEATAPLLSSLGSLNPLRKDSGGRETAGGAEPLPPSDERALLLVPQALGRIASRGGVRAMESLLSMTDPESLRRHDGKSGLADDLLEQAAVGLFLAGTSGALEQLNHLAGLTSIPGRVRRTAEALLSQAAEVSPASGAAAEVGQTAREPVVERVPDINSSGHRSGLTVANHIAAPLPITDAEIDAVLESATQVAGRADFSEDVSCCTTFGRAGTAVTFGSVDDGLDILDTNLEMVALLTNAVGRVKVVRLINYCGGTGTNIIGCAFSPGEGMAVVRLGANEGLLWLHEYGHNTGLAHNTDPRYVMYHRLGPQGMGLNQAECDLYHFPHPWSGANPEDIGICQDDDDDQLASTIDNCPDVFNPDQGDADGDGLGDDCEGCVDTDGDGFGSPPDPECPRGNVADCDDDDEQTYPGAPELCDGRDNDCDGPADEMLCSEVEATGDGVVNGVELVWLGRAFGRCASGGTPEWWWALDYTGDGCVDGNDLTVLVAAWGCTASEPICAD